MATPTTEKKPRAAKRNFAATVANVRNYCEMKIDILGQVAGDTAKDRIDELKAVLARLEAK